MQSLILIVMMESAREAKEDLKDTMAHIAQLNREKGEVKAIILDMEEQQLRLRSNRKLAKQQRLWALSLNDKCPPGSFDRDDCLIRQLRLRAAALKAQEPAERR